MPEKDFWEVEVSLKTPETDPRGAEACAHLTSFVPAAGASPSPPGIPAVSVFDLYYLQADHPPSLSESQVDRVARTLLADPVTQTYRVRHVLGGSTAGTSLPGAGAGSPGSPRSAESQTTSAQATSLGTRVCQATVLKKPGVMDPVEGSLLQALDDLGIDDPGVRGLRARTGTRYKISFPSAGAQGEGAAPLSPDQRRLLEKALSNPAIEEVHWEDVAPFSPAAPYRFQYREVPLGRLRDEDLLRLSREGQLSLSLEEMQAVKRHFSSLGRDPSDAELETIAQTWSEHCCHKTFTGILDHVRFHASPGEPAPGKPPLAGGDKVERFDNLLKQTIRRATEEINAPWCLSVFSDNAGVIAFDEDYGITFKVETHNHPSAIEPYGGAGTGVGGVLRDTLGTGLGAKPIVNTDVFCLAPPSLPQEKVPPGAIHPLRALKGVVSGVRDYGNRMGIPTASGALCFDPRYVANPLVFCGSVGILPRSAMEKSVEPGDLIYVLGGRTGRDGIHGATFSSVELSDASEVLSSGAVQIGNAITEKKLLDVLLQARDRKLFRAVTDCGAGGLSSAVGEMGARTGARVDLERVPLKYEGLSYWEIWISEAQERMVLAVPPERGQELEALARSEEVECTPIGEFTSTGRLVLLYEGHVVCDLDMSFLHEGRPRLARRSHSTPPRNSKVPWGSPPSLGKVLRTILAHPNVASKEWIIRQYDHEVQGRSVLKPLQGAQGDGPGDGVAFAPRFGSRRGVVLGAGICPRYGDLDPYRMALSAVDEAVRNVVAAGGDPGRTAILDNFCWGNTDRPETLGSLVEAAKGCYKAAVGLGTPFISGKDSLNNEFRAGEKVISIPPTLLISSVSVVEDVYRLASMDFKEAGSKVVLVGMTREELGGSHFFELLGVEGGEVPDLFLPQARRSHQGVHRAIRQGLVLSSHDLSEGGLAVAAAEMAFSGGIGAELDLSKVPREGCERDDAILFSESNSRYLLEVRPERAGELLSLFEGSPAAEIGQTVAYGILRVLGLGGKAVIAEALEDLKKAWKEPLDFSKHGQEL